MHFKEIAKVNNTHQQSPSLIHPHPLRQGNTRRHRFVIKRGASQMGGIALRLVHMKVEDLLQMALDFQPNEILLMKLIMYYPITNN